jgi:hypothetical protein
MPKTERTRIDYMPGDAAMEAINLAVEVFPNLRMQALLDRLVITAVSAIHHAAHHKPWQPPYLTGNSRDTWTLPDSMTPVKEYR